MAVIKVWVSMALMCVSVGIGADDDASGGGGLSLSSPNYHGSLAKAILFFEGQRSGRLPANQRVKWRGNSALTDGQGENVNLTGGYYDAGDNVKFGFPMAFTVTLLSWSALEYRNEVAAAGQLSHLRSAIHWGADFLLRAHTSPTTLYTQVGDGNADHQCWERPEDMDTPRTLYKITENLPGSEAAGEAAAALAAAYMVFKDDRDKTFATQLLAASRSLFDFANNYRGSFQSSCPFYCSYSGFQDELLWASAWLFRATKDGKYLDFLQNNQGGTATEFSWDNKYVGAQMLATQEYLAGRTELESYKRGLDSFVCAVMPNSGNVQIRTTPGGLLFTRDSINLQYTTTATLLLFIYSKTLSSSGSSGVQCSAASFSPYQIRSFAASQVDYILGKNPMGMSYMVGFGTKFARRIHHRGSSIPSIKVLPRKVTCNEGFSSWFPTSNLNPNIHVGAIVGGPDGNDQFRDNRGDSTHSEPATYINAAFVGACAAAMGQKQLEEPVDDLASMISYY
ncbi:endoglucanase 20-like [Phragmites australis]|uniref:endoglucanase 20-like n=1 Tax=Phragmites australis TaxID=29695 RepID=UPI002D7706C5|nr:endoglucanase 20-like [Phragmites australis]